MSLKIVTSMGHLFRLAKAEGEAERSFNANPTPENLKAYQAAKECHESYRKLCLQSDEMATGFTASALAPR